MGNVCVFSFLEVCCKLVLHNTDTVKEKLQWNEAVKA